MSQLMQAPPQTRRKVTGSSIIRSNLLQRATITPVHGSVLQRCSNGVECAECRQKQLEHESTLQRSAVNSAPTNGIRPIVHDVLNSPGQPLDAGTQAFMEPRFGHDFSGVGVDTNAKTRSSAHNALSENVRGKRISSSGAGTVNISYTPEAKDKSSKIVFIQVMRELLDDKPAKPSESDKDFSFQDSDTTSDFYHVDYKEGEKDPYYNGDDPQDFGTKGNAVSTPKITATMDDTPSYDDSAFPPGKSKIKYEFRTAAYSAAGADQGTYYEYVDWTYEKEKGKPDKTVASVRTGTGDPGSRFVDAVKLWNANHGGHVLLGALIGGLAGAAIGSLFGPVGTIVGGLVGGLAGGLLGSIFKKVTKKSYAEETPALPILNHKRLAHLE